MISEIASVVVHGATNPALFGTSEEADSFAFTASKIRQFEIGGAPVALSKKGLDQRLLRDTADVWLIELR